MRLLRDAPENWKRNEQYFRVLNHIAGLGAREAHFLVANGFVARLVDFYLGDESPNPEVSNIPIDAKGRRKRMGDEWNIPDWTQFLALLQTLVTSTTPAHLPSNAPTPSTLWIAEKPFPARASLSPIDLKLLMYKDFMARFLALAVTRKRGVYISNTLCHLCWESMEITEHIVGYVGHSLEENSDEEIRPLFRTIAALLNMKDSLQEKRVSLIMNSLLAVMKVQQQFWRVTQLCIDHIIRLAKRNPAVYSWLNKNAAKMQWLGEYAVTYARPPAYNDPSMSLLKRDNRNQYADHRLGYASALSARQKLAVFDAIREGKALDDSNASDSDEDLSERVFEVGQWIDCKDTVNKWCEASVAAIQDDMLRIHYDGWTEKWDEWIERSSSRITRYGRFTSATPRDKFKGKGPQQGDNLGGGRRFMAEDFAQLRQQQQQLAEMNQQQENMQGGAAEGGFHQ